MKASHTNFKQIADVFAKQAAKISISLQDEDRVLLENFC
jgi:hypothetical protein